MRRVRGRDTGPELKVRRALRALGVGYRLGGCGLPGRPDLVMKGRRLALFVHGCFWHGHDCRRGARQPKANAAYWIAKIARNRARDAAALAALDDMGWRTAVIWECELGPELSPRLADLVGRQATARVDRSSPARTASRAPSRAGGVRGLETK